jgi:hypothetical protein
MSTNGPPPPEEPKPTNPPLSKFSYFTRLSAETRANIWTIAILRDLGAAQEAPPYEIAPKGTRIKRDEGGGGWGRARNPQAPSPPPALEQPEQPEQLEPKEAPPRLHIIPFHTLPTEEPFTSVHNYLAAKYGEDWEGPVHAGLSFVEAEAVTAQRQARVAEGKEAVWKHARTRMLLFPPGQAPGTGAQFSGGWLRSALVGCCREAEAVAHSLGRVANYGDGGSGGGGAGDDDDGGVVGQEILVGLGRGDVCCFVNVHADGSPIGWREMLQFWGSRDNSSWNRWPNVYLGCGQSSSYDHLGLLPGGEEWAGAVREGWGCDDKMLVGVSGLKGLLPALSQCEVLAGVWHPAMCTRFRPNLSGRITGSLADSELCANFKWDLESLPLRYPRLKTIYIIDPMIKPKPKDSLIGTPKPTPTFRGRGVTHYPAFSSYFMSETHPGYPYRHGKWRHAVKEILRAVTRGLGEDRPQIKLSVLACVPDDDSEQDPWGINQE